MGTALTIAVFVMLGGVGRTALCSSVRQLGAQDMDSVVETLVLAMLGLVGRIAR